MDLLQFVAKPDGGNGENLVSYYCAVEMLEEVPHICTLFSLNKVKHLSVYLFGK